MTKERWMAAAGGGELDDLDSLDVIPTDDEAEHVERRSLENLFGVGDENGEIVLRRRPNGRLSYEQGLNLAAWIIAVTEVDIADVEELTRRAVESL